MPPERRASRISPEQQEKLRKGLATLQSGDTQGARDLLMDLLEEDPELAAGHVGLGRVFAAEGDHVRAIEHFEEACAIQPGYAEASLQCANSYEALGDIEGAITALDGAIEGNPTRSTLYMRKSRLLQEHGRHDEARETLEQGVRRNPRDSVLRTSLGTMLDRDGNRQGALQNYRRAAELDPDNWLSHFSLGVALMREDQFEEAHAALSRAADLDPTKARAHQSLGYVLSRLGDHSSAALAYEAALTLEPNDTRSILGAANAMFELGDYRRTLDLIKSAGRRANRSPGIQRLLGDTYLAMGRAEAAIEIYRALILNSSRYQEVDPDLMELADAEPEKDAEAHARAMRDALEDKRLTRREERQLEGPDAPRRPLAARMGRGQGFGARGGGGARRGGRFGGGGLGRRRGGGPRMFN